ncbi:MAG: nucleotidyltransferase domain-containing protein [Nanoarchaeota archaeon]
MLTGKQLAILEVFRKNLGKKLSFNEIKKQAGINSNDFIQRVLSSCIEEEILTTESIGRNILYKIKLTPRTLSYFSIIPFTVYHLPEKTLNEIHQEVSKETSFFSLIIFGSFAKKQETKKSDIDIAIILENEKKTNQIEARVESLKLKSLLQLDIHLISSKDFKEMLNSEKENLGKEIARNHLVYSNPGIFYKIIEKWIQFKDSI